MTEVEALITRFDEILAAYENAGMGDANFPLLRHLLMEPAFDSVHAEGCFAAVLSDDRRRGTSAPREPMSDAARHEERRLNGEGLWQARAAHYQASPPVQEPYQPGASRAGRSEPENHPGPASKTSLPFPFEEQNP